MYSYEIDNEFKIEKSQKRTFKYQNGYQNAEHFPIRQRRAKKSNITKRERDNMVY